jgi:hypothetical protein
MVQQWLLGHVWVLDIAGPLSVDATIQFFRLWDAVARVPTGGEGDAFRWNLEVVGGRRLLLSISVPASV